MTPIGNGVIRRHNFGIVLNSVSLSTWDLATNDLATAVQGAGFFNALASKMKIGDVINARVDLDGTPQLKSYLVTANTGSVVTVALQTVA